MRIEVDGVEYLNFESASATVRLDALSNTFSFEATSEEARPLPFLGGEACRVLVDGEVVLTGFIEVVDASGDSGSHSIGIVGRDKTGDLLDSTIDKLSDLRGGRLALKTIIERVIAHLNPKDPTFIRVVDLAKPASFNPAEDLHAPEPGQNAFEFIEKLARKRQVLLTSNGDGDVVITASSGKEVNASIQHRVKDNRNNVISYSVSHDTTGRYNLYKSRAQLNATATSLAGTTSNDSIVNQGDAVQATDKDIRRGRQLVLVSENMSSGTENQNRARWEANIRKARGRVYSAVVDGFRNQTGNLWTINELVRVHDEYAGIEATMLVNSVEYSLSPDEGRTCTLSLVERNAYTLELEEPETEEIGSGLAL